jgi:5'-nucleotidase
MRSATARARLSSAFAAAQNASLVSPETGVYGKKMPRPLVLLSNDDGYRSPGIRALKTALLTWADVVLCAPDAEQSAASHALSINRPLRLLAHEEGVFSVDGTPADSVYLALNLEGFLARAPDMVVSGLNHGLNMGRDVFYSGTVAAAREGALSGLVALAVSAARDADVTAAAKRAAEIALGLWQSGLRGSRLFNANFPREGSWEVVPTRLGERIYNGGMIERTDPRGQKYYWIGGSDGGARHEHVLGSDTEAYDAGKIGLTPLVLDLWSSHLETDAELVVKQLSALDRPI